MIICYVILLFVVLWGASGRKEDNPKAYLSIKQTKSIQGIFVVLVMLSHFSSYIDTNNVNVLDTVFLNINNRIGQLMVVMFLFYSGYGIMEKIKSDSKKYLDGFLIHRFLPVYAKFVVSIFLFLVLDICLGLITKYSFGEIVLSFIGWTSIGNSNWFMFATFILYFFVFLSFKILDRGSIRQNLMIFSFFVIIYILAFSLVIKRGTWWYNTILCFPFGMWFSYFRDCIEKFCYKYYWKISITCIMIFCCFYLLQDRIPYMYCLLALVFCALVILLTMKLKLGNKILDFFGRHIFSIYILQRLSYILFGRIGNVYLFLLVSFLATLSMAILLDYSFEKGYKNMMQRVKES